MRKWAQHVQSFVPSIDIEIVGVRKMRCIYIEAIKVSMQQLFNIETNNVHISPNPSLAVELFTRHTAYVMDQFFNIILNLNSIAHRDRRIPDVS